MGLVLAETMVRVVVGAPQAERLPVLEIRANPHRGWEMVPGKDHYTYSHHVHVNRYGLRGAEIGPKANHVVRVLALGDSLVYGQGVGDDQTIPTYLASRLNDRDRLGRRWNVINGGHRAYNTRQELALLEELGPDLAPDIVVLFWFWNDLEEIQPEKVYRRLKDKGDITFDTKGRIEGLERLRWQAIQIVRRSALIMYLHDLVALYTSRTLEPRFVEDGLKRLEGALDRMVQLSRLWNFDLVVAIIPDPNSLASRHESISVGDQVVAMARSRRIPTVRLLDPLRKLYGRTAHLPVIPFDGHYIPEANQVMAESVADLILDTRTSSEREP